MLNSWVKRPLDRVVGQIVCELALVGDPEAGAKREVEIETSCLPRRTPVTLNPMPVVAIDAFRPD